jgi:hypothetical protein
VLAKRAEEGEFLSQDDLAILDEFAYETLDRIMQEYCLPYTYFGAHPADGSDVGCWPNLEALDEAVEYGDVTVTKIEAGSLEAIQLIQGQYQSPTPYVWVHNEERNEDSLWDMTRQKPLWTY